jgi:hypothetical protein
MSKEKDLTKYQEIQEYLETEISKNNINAIQEYVANHNDDIWDIYCNFGSGSEYLRSSYNKICFSNPELALKYQELLEAKVAGDVLFSDE